MTRTLMLKGGLKIVSHDLTLSFKDTIVTWKKTIHIKKTKPFRIYKKQNIKLLSLQLRNNKNISISNQSVPLNNQQKIKRRIKF